MQSGISKFLAIACSLHPALMMAQAAKPQLPDAPGKAITQKLCGGCHGAELVLGKPHSEDGWGAIVLDMVQRGCKGSDEELYEVIQYLTKNIKTLPKVNVNKATAKEIESTLMIEAKDAEAIVKAREKAEFKTAEDVKKVPGIDAKIIEARKVQLDF